MPDPIRVLLVDADEDGAVLMRGLIAGMAAPADVERAASFALGLARMTSRRYDVHLVACRLAVDSGAVVVGGSFLGEPRVVGCCSVSTSRLIGRPCAWASSRQRGAVSWAASRTRRLRSTGEGSTRRP